MLRRAPDRNLRDRSSPRPPSPGSRLAPELLAALVVLGAIFVGLGARALWNPVEPRYAGIALRIADGGPWLVPEYEDLPYDQKPPLVFWFVAALHRLAGGELNLFLVRLPSALGALLGALGLVRLGRRHFGARAGLWAGLVYGSSALVVWSGRFLHLDTLCAASLIWSLHASLVAVDTRGPARRRAIALATAALALGLYTKGAPPLLFTALTLAGTAPALRDRRVLTRAGLGWSLGGAFALFLAWFLPAWAAMGHGWWREILVEQGLSRLVSERPPRKHDALYYLYSLLGALTPWAPLLPFALVAAVRALRSRGPARLEPAARRGLVLALVWLLVTLVVLNLGETRRIRYLMVALPAAALLLGWYLDHAFAKAAGERNRLAPRLAAALAALAPAVLALLLAALAFAGEAVAGRFRGAAAAVFRGLADSPLAIPIGVSALVLLVLAVRAVLADRPLRALGHATAILVLGWAFWGLVGAPAHDRHLDDEPLLALVRPELAAGAELWGIEGVARRESAWGWYYAMTRRSIRVDDLSCEQVRAAVAAGRRVVLVRERKKGETAPPEIEGMVRLNEKPVGRRASWVFADRGRSTAR
ncbi:MAG: glycosyltransferase family 39 protein [Planctomycetota bacterium]